MTKEKQLVDLLLARTRAGTTSWEPTAEEDEFVTSVGGNSIWIRTVEPRNASDNEPDVVLNVRDGDGRQVFSLYNGEGIADLDFQTMRALHEAARRSALKIDQIMEAILKDLRGGQ
ncbi:MAG TPA: hypothetical protein VGR84_01360 [Candidatus Acidoferrales bacterium]|nr:hypothetical protein [Candidatus Acidoferrales bacterium]